MSGVANVPERAAPVIKAVGGKTRLLPELLARMPSTFERYHEPFAGGAALFFRVGPERATLNDGNRDLMALYRTLVADVDGVIVRLREHTAAHGPEHYYDVRARWNDGRIECSTARAAAYVYLNKTCFNGLWRVNRAGAFNAALGCYENPRICDEPGLRAAAAALAGASLSACDYRATLGLAERGDFVYLDPPYDGTFAGYTSAGFGVVQQAELAHHVRTLVDRGVHVMVSNADTPRVRALYAGMRIDVVQCSRSINRDGAGRAPVNEVIIIAGGEPAGRLPANPRVGRPRSATWA